MRAEKKRYTSIEMEDADRCNTKTGVRGLVDRWVVVNLSGEEGVGYPG